MRPHRVVHVFGLAEARVTATIAEGVSDCVPSRHVRAASRRNVLRDTGEDKPANWWWGHGAKSADAALMVYVEASPGQSKLQAEFSRQCARRATIRRGRYSPHRSQDGAHRACDRGFRICATGCRNRSFEDRAAGSRAAMRSMLSSPENSSWAIRTTTAIFRPRRRSRRPTIRGTSCPSYAAFAPPSTIRRSSGPAPTGCTISAQTDRSLWSDSSSRTSRPSTRLSRTPQAASKDARGRRQASRKRSSRSGSRQSL